MRTEFEKMISRLVVAGFVAVAVRYGGAKPAGTNAPPEKLGTHPCQVLEKYGFLKGMDVLAAVVFRCKGRLKSRGSLKKS